MDIDDFVDGNQNTVYVVQYDGRKDFSSARKYGQLRAVFNNVRKPYETDALIKMARERMQDMRDGDKILVVGDPTLCGLCMAVAAEMVCTVEVLSWDRMKFDYDLCKWDFYKPPM
jgi:hypothetical protein